MAETLTATSPLQGFHDKFANVPPTVELSEEPFVAMLDLRVDADGPAASRGVGHPGAAASEHPIDIRQRPTP